MRRTARVSSPAIPLYEDQHTEPVPRRHEQADRRIKPRARGAELVGQWCATNTDLFHSAIAVLDTHDQEVLNEALRTLKRLVAFIDEQAEGPIHSRSAGIPGTRMKNE